MLGAILAHASSEAHASAQSVAFGTEGRITAIHPLFDDPRARVGELRILPELEAIGVLTLTHIPDQPYAVRFA